MSFDMREINFWLDYMMDHWLEHDNLHTWAWAFIVSHDGQIIVRHGPFWEDTGIYCSKRIIRGCDWE